MAKAARGMDRRGVKDWFSGLTFEVQQSVLQDFSQVMEFSKSERISALEKELASLRGEGGSVTGGRVSKPSSPKKGGSIAPKFKDPVSENTWAGRGMQPVWVREYLKKRGTKLDDLLIDKKGAR